MWLILLAVVGFLYWISRTKIPGGPGTVTGEDLAAGFGGEGLKPLSDIAAMIAEAANKAGLNPDLALAVARVESGLDPNAVSPAGAGGVFQLMPGTADALGVANVFDPAANIAGGTRYLSDLLKQYGGDYQKALAAYNWGPGRVDSAVAEFGDEWDQHLPAETSSYLDKVINLIGG
jgi:soluble lytic murein transglycosylase-like protein